MSKNISSIITGLSVGVAIILLFPYGMIGASAQASAEKIIELQVGGKSYPIHYRFSNGGTIEDIEIARGLTELKLNLTAQSDGNLEITIPREVSDASSFTVSSPLVLFVDDVPIEPEIPLTKSCEQTSFIVPVKADYREIAVVGAVILSFKPHYPVEIEQMKTFNEEGQNFTIRMITDAKKCDATFSKEEKKIHIEIKGRDEASNTQHGNFYLSVPHELLDGNYSVYVDGKPEGFKESVYSLPGNAGTFESGISFNYTKDTTSVDIVGTTAIPEFSSFAVIVMAASAAALVVLFHKKVHMR